MARPKMAEQDKKIVESVYLSPKVHAWITAKAKQRSASTSSLIDVILSDRMLKDSK